MVSHNDFEACIQMIREKNENNEKTIKRLQEENRKLREGMTKNTALSVI